MLTHQHPLREGGRGVLRQDRDAGLGQHRAVVDPLGHQVHGAAGFGVARGDGARMGVEARIQGQQAGVNVQHPSRPSPDQPGSQQPHIAGKRHHPDVMRFKRRLHGTLVPLPVRTEGAVRDDRRGDALGGGHSQTGRVSPVREHQDHLERGAVGVRSVDQGGHVRPRAGDQDGDSHAAGAGGGHQLAGRGAGSPTETKEPAGPGKTTGLS